MMNFPDGPGSPAAIASAPAPSSSATLHAALIAKLRSPQREAALAEALRHLYGNGGDLHLLLAMLHACVDLGVAGLAVRVLESAGRPRTDRPELASLRDELAALPSGEVARDELDGRFAENLRILEAVDAELADAVRDDGHAQHDVFVYRTHSRNELVVQHDPHGRVRFVLAPNDHQGQAQAMALPTAQPGAGFALVGVPSPPLLARLGTMRSSEGYVPPIDVIESHRPAFRAWLRIVDLNGVEPAERLRCYVGPDAAAQYERSLTDRPTRLLATHVITSKRPHEPPQPLPEQMTARIRAARSARRAKALRRQGAWYESRSPAEWAARFAPDAAPPLRIAGFTTRFSSVVQHAMRDLARAFERRGCTFDVFKEPSACGEAIDFDGVLAEGRYDLVVGINHLRHQHGGAIHPNVPFVAWLQDHMPEAFKADAGRQIGPFDLVLGHARSMMCDRYGYPEAQFIATSNLTDPETYCAEAVAEEFLAPLRCDVSYVSHGGGGVEQLLEQIAGGRNAASFPILKRFADLVEAALASGGALPLLQQLALMDRALAELSHPPVSAQQYADMLAPAVWRIHDRLLRHQTVEWLAQWAEAPGRALHLYGRGWDGHPRFARYARGVIDNGEPLRRLHQASAVNIQVNGYGSLHQRMLDGVASGGLVLSRHNASDWHGLHLRRLTRCIAERGIGSLKALHDAAQEDADLHEEVEAFEASFGAPVIREPQTFGILQRWGLMSGDAEPHAAVFHMLRTGRGIIIDRVAGEIDGFGDTCFRSREELHAMLDRFVDDPDARRALAAPLRACVLQHDTYDMLVERIVTNFREQFESWHAAGG